MNTDSLTYDINTHRYYITSDGFTDRFGEELKFLLSENKVSGITEEAVFIKQVTDRVYRWLWAYIPRQNRKIVEKWMFEDININGVGFKESIEEALYAQAEYMINFDGDMKAIAEDDYNRLVSIETKSELIASGIAYRGIYDVEVTNYREGY